MRTEAQFPHGARVQWRINVKHRWVSLVVEDDAVAKRAQLDALLAVVAQGIAELAVVEAQKAEAQKVAYAAADEAEAATESAVASETPAITDEEVPL